MNAILFCFIVVLLSRWTIKWWKVNVVHFTVNREWFHTQPQCFCRSIHHCPWWGPMMRPMMVVPSANMTILTSSHWCKDNTDMVKEYNLVELQCWWWRGKAGDARLHLLFPVENRYELELKTMKDFVTIDVIVKILLPCISLTYSINTFPSIFLYCHCVCVTVGLPPGKIVILKWAWAISMSCLYYLVAVWVKLDFSSRVVS